MPDSHLSRAGPVVAVAAAGVHGADLVDGARHLPRLLLLLLSFLWLFTVPGLARATHGPTWPLCPTRPFCPPSKKRRTAAPFSVSSLPLLAQDAQTVDF